MALDSGPDNQSPQDELLSKVDALLRRHRDGGLDAALLAGDEPDIPTLTDLIEEPGPPAEHFGEPDAGTLGDPETLTAATEPEKKSAVPTDHSVVTEAGPSHDFGHDTIASAGIVQDHTGPPQTVPPRSPDQEWLARLRPEIERLVAETLATRLPSAIQERVIPDVMRQLGDGLNRLRDEMRTTIQSVVRETIEREVKRALRALLKERSDR